MNISQPQISLRPPTPNDGASVFRLIGRCPPLDTNSMYCNLLQCSHFAGTSVAAVQSVDSKEELVGFISAYLLPEREDTLFIWQVAVDERARGIGLAGNMLKQILDRPQCNKITHLETTITESNKASWALFESLTNKLETTLQKSIMFDQDIHLAGEHDTEFLARIGPLKSVQS